MDMLYVKHIFRVFDFCADRWGLIESMLSAYPIYELLIVVPMGLPWGPNVPYGIMPLPPWVSMGPHGPTDQTASPAARSQANQEARQPNNQTKQKHGHNNGNVNGKTQTILQHQREHHRHQDQ